MHKLITITVLLNMLLACQPSTSGPAVAEGPLAPEYINPNPRAPYSEGVRYNGLIFLAGKTGGAGQSGLHGEIIPTL